MRTPVERELWLRIGAGLVEGGDEGSSLERSIALLDDRRASEIAADMLLLYELLGGLESDPHA
jgi:hypothetical protein